ncbi:hypothetical protein MTF66_33460 [Pseudoalteromonas sp. 2CM39R]|uniref:hypothetical protein n=1 Tax=Pseudoalteromonas sp. 2CM39R TaxID=2929856 RepID=UPI0020BE74FE|nr:hypothetical protein [Pseudoalteromonas sp. 2CM39R]MCK8129955.1 hypothetical protein [Pseudoalteromonas sp. 2CM39R]
MDEWIVRVLVAFVFTVIGWLAGHRLALGRDKRKEYNDAIEPIRNILLSNRVVSELIVTEIDVKLGKRAHKILKVYRESYKPLIDKASSLCGSDDYGQYGPLKAHKDEYEFIWTEAKKRMLEVCKHK